MIYINIGSNLPSNNGDRKNNIKNAIKLLNEYKFNIIKVNLICIFFSKVAVFFELKKKTFVKLFQRLTLLPKEQYNGVPSLLKNLF